MWGGGRGVARETSLTTLVTRESRPWVRKACSLIHHAPLSPLSFQPSHSGFLFCYFLLALSNPPAADGGTSPSTLLMAMKRRRGQNENVFSGRTDVVRDESVRNWTSPPPPTAPQTTFYIWRKINKAVKQEFVSSARACGERKNITQWHDVSHFHSRFPTVLCSKPPRAAETAEGR